MTSVKDLAGWEYRLNMAIICLFQTESTTNSTAAAARFLTILLLSLFLASKLSYAADYPEATITNGQVTAKMYLPDAKNGYYRSTRFDWSGAVYSLAYKGHDYYGPWFDSVDPNVINWVYRDGKIVDGPCGALEGPVDEFQTPLGWDEAKPGGTFIKIGVGVLRKAGRNTTATSLTIL